MRLLNRISNILLFSILLIGIHLVKINLSQDNLSTRTYTSVQTKTTFIDYRNEVKDFILLHEGGMSNHSADPGGWTNKGVTFSTFRLFSKQLDYKPSIENFKAMPDSIWDKIYALHWNKFQEVEDVRIRSFCTDYLWGSGTMAITNIQSVVQLYVPEQQIDGAIGDETINNINKCNPDLLLDSLYKQRIHFLKNLSYSSYFYTGWKRRVDSLMKKFKKWEELQEFT